MGVQDKRHDNGKIERYKARVVAKGYGHMEEDDYR